MMSENIDVKSSIDVNQAASQDKLINWHPEQIQQKDITYASWIAFLHGCLQFMTLFCLVLYCLSWAVISTGMKLNKPV